jgi:Na+/H+-dicarboxylate symporter
MAALFLAQAVGMDLAFSKQMIIVISSIMAGAGIAGIPEAGLIVLPLVLGAAKFDDRFIAAALPLIIPVDWILARARSGVNVMADMLVAILLDVGYKPECDGADVGEAVEAEENALVSKT